MSIDPASHTWATLKDNHDGTHTITNVVVIEADHLVRAADLGGGAWIGWTCDSGGTWKAPKPTKETEPASAE